MKKVSVIVPIYKAEEYIDRCVESIINQTYDNIEIIQVNVGSPDNSPMICDEWSNKDKRIKVIHKENGGVSSARNAGLDNATGEYVLFIDSDDYIDEKYVNNLVNSIKDKDSFSLASCFILEKSNEIIKKYISDDILSLYRYPAVWLRLFNKKYIDDINLRFEKTSSGEDLEFVTKLLIYNNNYSLSKDSIYHYTVNEKSLTHTKDDHFLEILETINRIEEFAKKNNRFDEFYSTLEFINILHVLYYLGNTLKSFDSNYDEKSKMILKYVVDKYPNWMNNKYISDLVDYQKEFLIETYKKRS